MSAYPTLLDGMIGSSQTTASPRLALDLLVAPRVPSDGVRARLAPMGLRRIEAALVASGFSPDDVAVVAPHRLSKAVGHDTRIIALSSGDPLGRGMNTNTMTAIAGGRSWTEVLFKRLLAKAVRLKRDHPALRIVVGGPGAWQLAQHDDARRSLGIDVVLTGYSETTAPALFRQAIAGENVEGVIPCDWPGLAGVPNILRPSVMGIVETSRGCGLGCDFCTLAKVPMVHFPADFIVRDVEVNLASGARNIGLISEDLFRYGGTASAPRPQELLALLRRLRKIDGLGMLQLDHANVSSVAACSDAELADIHLLLSGSRPRPVWLNLGVETASGRLLSSLPARAKMRPFDAAGWAEGCREQVRRLARAGILPMVSLVIGLEGETPEDIEITRRWVESLSGERVLVFPLLMAPTDSSRAPFGRRDLRPDHWALIKSCYRFNFKWLPGLFWSEQTAAGVGISRRVALAATARANVPWWKMLLALRS